MKLFSIRILLNAAAALSLLASVSSCTKVNIDNPDQAEQYIGFTSSVETKAPIESSEDMNEFAVWAYRSDDAASLPELEMNGIEVYSDGTGWAYDNIRMWTDGEWNFEAFYPFPFTLTVTEIVQGKDALEVIFTTPKEEQSGLEGLSINYYYGPTASHDLMTAEYTRNYNSASPSPDASPVQFEFKHLLSRVSIAVKAASEGVTLNSLTFEGMSVLGEYNMDADEPDTWQLLTSIPELSNVRPGHFPADLTEVADQLPSDGTSVVNVLSDLLLIPQTPGASGSGNNEMTLTVSFTVGTQQEEETETITLPSEPAWQQGRHYRYTLTLGGADVTLSVKMEEWDERDYTVIF